MLVFHGQAFHVHPDWKNTLASIGLAEDKDWKSLQSDNQVSGSYNTTNSFCFSLDNGETIYFKRYVYKNIRFKSWLQPSKAQVEAAGLTELKTMGIPTIDVLAYGEERRFGMLRGAFLVTRGRDHLCLMDRYISTIWHRLPAPDKLQTLVRIQTILIKQLQTIHSNGFYHWDLKLRNLLLYQPDNMNSDVIWIDCPRSRLRAANDLGSVTKDFAAMARVGCRALTLGQQFRFLLNYYNGDRQQARALFKKVAQILKKNPPRPLWHVLDQNDPEFIKHMNQRQDRQSD